MHFRVDVSREEREQFAARAVQLEGLWSELRLTHHGCELLLTLHERLDNLIAIEGWIDQSSCVFSAEFRHYVPITADAPDESLDWIDGIPPRDGADLIAYNRGSGRGVLVEVRFRDSVNSEAANAFMAEMQKVAHCYQSFSYPHQTRFNLASAQWLDFQASFSIDDDSLEQNLAVVVDFVSKLSRTFASS